jgi:Domain of unknown function (DUF1833)
MSAYASFFLNSSSSVVQLETVDIYHPNFSKRYRVVRNALNGLTATLEDSSVGIFEYYPLKIVPTGSSDDLDQTLSIQFGDLGSILPMEIDRVLVGPQTLPIPQGACVGAWLDAGGNLCAPPFLIGNGTLVYVPQNAVSLGFGINDNAYADNTGTWSIAINGGTPVVGDATKGPYNFAVGGINAAYPYLMTGTTGINQTPVTPGAQILLSFVGSWSYASGPAVLLDGLGVPIGGGVAAAPISTGPGNNVPVNGLPGTYVKPIVLYRTYRSDDLTTPLYGPITFQAQTITFKKDGATLACSAPRLNQTSTGEIYDLTRFPMLNGFI